MIQAIILNLIEWVASKGAAAVWAEIQAAIAKHKTNVALEKNQQALQKADKSGDYNAINQAAEDSLNNKH